MPLRETYGMSEAVAAASECSAGRLHLWPEVGWLEVLSDEAGAEDGTGELVTTGLLNLDMPLIRYRVGDRGPARGQGRTCACGRTLPMFASLEVESPTSSTWPMAGWSADLIPLSSPTSRSWVHRSSRRPWIGSWSSMSPRPTTPRRGAACSLHSFRPDSAPSTLSWNRSRRSLARQAGNSNRWSAS